MTTEITPVLLCFNEEPNIARTLDQLQWAKRIVVIDSGSSDGTLKTVANYSQAEVFVRTFDSFAAQWNFGLSKVTTKWALCLDADCVLTDNLVTELQTTSLDKECSGYKIPFSYCINGQPLKGSLLPPRVVLIPTTQRFVNDGHFQRVEDSINIKSFRSSILHDDRKPLRRWAADQVAHAELEAKKLRSHAFSALNIQDKLRRMYIAPFIVGLYALFIRGTVLDGRIGLIYAIQRTIAELFLSHKLLEKSTIKSAPDA